MSDFWGFFFALAMRKRETKVEMSKVNLHLAEDELRT